MMAKWNEGHCGEKYRIILFTSKVQIFMLNVVKVDDGSELALIEREMNAQKKLQLRTSYTLIGPQFYPNVCFIFAW